MMNNTRRYFIELHPSTSAPVPRNLETAVRREQALRYMAAVHEWLQQQSLANKVAAMSVTAFGQLHITCESEVINCLRQHDEMAIAAIRPGLDFPAHLSRM